MGQENFQHLIQLIQTRPHDANKIPRSLKSGKTKLTQPVSRMFASNENYDTNVFLFEQRDEYLYLVETSCCWCLAVTEYSTSGEDVDGQTRRHIG